MQSEIRFPSPTPILKRCALTEPKVALIPGVPALVSKVTALPLSLSSEYYSCLAPFLRSLRNPKKSKSIRKKYKLASTPIVTSHCPVGTRDVLGANIRIAISIPGVSVNVCCITNLPFSMQSKQQLQRRIFPTLLPWASKILRHGDIALRP